MADPQHSDTQASFWRRYWRPAAALALVAALVGTFDWVDRPAAGYYEAAFQRALVTFALARTLNGVISVVQGTEVAVEPGGVGVTLAPGEILDPINDLIERFSWLMVMSTTSLGVQKILMDISGWWGIRALLVLTAVIYVVVRIRGGNRARRWAGRLVAGAVILRFVMPLLVLFNHALYEAFMRDDVETATQAVVETTEGIKEMQADEQQVEMPEEGWLSSARRWFDEKLSQMNVSERAQAYVDRLSSATEHLLRLAAVFVLQTVIVPLLFLWAMVRGIPRIFTARWGSSDART